MLGKNKDTKGKGWKISIDRPEEMYGEPSLYYTADEVERYARSGGIQKTQQKIAERILELLKLKSGRILDLGCGPGYTMEVYKNAGFDVLGLDILSNMLNKAREKGLNCIQGNMKDLPVIFKRDEFDGVVSASALQWLKQAQDVEQVARGIYYVLKEKGKFVIQFYPKSQDEMMKTAKIFKNAGFEGQIIVDNPHNPIKRVIFIVMQKSKVKKK